MAACLVPEFPAVMAFLEQLTELDKQLKEDGAPFSPAASLHLTEISAAITALEAERRYTREQLEVETIENSKLRHHNDNTRKRISQEIKADVAAARASNAEEIKHLQHELSNVSYLLERAVKRQDEVLKQNEELIPEQQQVKAEHEEVKAALNDLITLKYDKQNQLSQTREQVEKLEKNITAVRQTQKELQKNLVEERDAFKVKKNSLIREEEQAEEKIHQTQVIRNYQKELNRVNNDKQVSHASLGELTAKRERINNKIERLAETRCRCEKQLEEETQKQEELREQIETLKGQLCELKENFVAAVKPLKEEIALVEAKTEEKLDSKALHQETLAKICEVLKGQTELETDVRAGYLHVTQKLERSSQQLKERTASITKHSQEINEMDKQMRELLEEVTINKHMFESNQKEISGDVDAEKENIILLQEENKRLIQFLEEAKRMQEEHVHKMTTDINSTERRYKELLQQEAELHQRQPKSVDANLLLSYIKQCEDEYKQIDSEYQQAIEKGAAETETIMRCNEERQKEVEEKEKILKDVEEKLNEEQSRHQGLEKLACELRKRKSELELSIEGLKEQTSFALQSKEELKAELKELRGKHMDTLDKQASELRAVEISIYVSRVKLEQVDMENSRLLLAITQMTEDVSRARADKERYWLEEQQLQKDKAALRESQQEAWKEDFLLTQDCQSKDYALLMSMTHMLDTLKCRNQQLVKVSTLLHQQMLEFSKRLGDTAAGEPRS